MGPHADHRVGDRIRIKSGRWRGQRGLIRELLSEGELLLTVEDARPVIASDSITNFSLAARRAWVTRPKRAGRPMLAKPRKKMVSLRIDIETIDALSVLSEHGLITNREQAVNEWLKERTRELLEELPRADRVTGARD